MDNSDKVISCEKACRQFKAFIEQEHDIWRAWPNRFVTHMANQLGVDFDTLLFTLEHYVNEQLRWLNKRKIDIEP